MAREAPREDPLGDARRPRPGTAPAEGAPGTETNDRAWARWTSAGFEFAAAVLLFFLLGSWADATWATHPWMKVAGAGLGVAAGMYALIRRALESERRDEARRSGRPPD